MNAAQNAIRIELVALAKKARAEGFTVAIWSPDEVKKVSRAELESYLVEAGNEYIEVRAAHQPTARTAAKVQP